MNVGVRIPQLDAESAQRGFDLRGYLNFAWRHWKLIGAITSLALLIAAIYVARATPLYTATTLILLDLQPQKVPGIDAVVNQSGISDVTAVENQLAILSSDSLLRRVVAKKHLAGPSASAKDPQDAAEGVSAADAKKIEDQHVQEAINSLQEALKVRRGGEGHVLKIAITWNDPREAAQLANALADAYIVDQLDSRFESAKRASAWLSDRLVELRQQLKDSEQAVADFRASHGLTPTTTNVTLNEQQISDLNNKLLAARTDVAEKKTRVDFLNDVVAGKRTLASLPDSFQSGAQTGIVAGLRQKLADASQRGADLLARYSNRHPAVVNVEAEKRDIERSIEAETQRMIATVKSEYALAKSREGALEQAMREATGQGGLNGDAAVQLRELERTAAVNKSLFEDFLQKAKITEEQGTFRARDARVILPAQPGIKSFPRTGIVLMIALVVGLGLGVGGATAMEMLSTGFTTPRQVEDALGVPVLASVRQLDKSTLVNKEGAPIQPPFYQLHYPLSPFSEAMRSLRSGIHMSDVDRPPKIIQITSARPGEGKTTIAISLAVSAASSGLKVALLDADLRHPSTSRFFRLEKEKGLVDLLTGSVKPDEVLIYRKDIKLMIIPAGSKSLNPSDVLGSERMKTLVAQLQRSFDYVVIDTPPIGPVVDPAMVAGLADKTVFVIHWGTTPRELIESSVKKLSLQKRIAGVVLNFVNQDRAKKYGGEYYYGKSYEKYYSE